MQLKGAVRHRVDRKFTWAGLRIASQMTVRRLSQPDRVTRRTNLALPALERIVFGQIDLQIDRAIEMPESRNE